MRGRSTEKRSPGGPQEAGKKAEREGGREKTEQKNPQAHPRKNTRADTVLASARAKKKHPTSDFKSSLPKIYRKQKVRTQLPSKNGG